MDALTVRETARLLGVDEATVRDWVRRGLLAVGESLWNRGRGKMMITPESLFSPKLPVCPKADLAALGRLQNQNYLKLRSAS
jgi:transposase-like protein